MGKVRNKRGRKAEKQDQRTREEVARAYAKASARLSRGNPHAPDEPDARVYAPLKPRPNLRSGATALPEPDSGGTFVVHQPKYTLK